MNLQSTAFFVRQLLEKEFCTKALQIKRRIVTLVVKLYCTCLKKGIVIFFLFVFLFNIVGYKAFYFYQIQNADSRLESKILSSNISTEKLITIKIPVNLPYLVDWADYQPMEGEVVFKKETYRYIKKKIARDTVFLVCIDHHEKTQLENNSDEFFKKVNDLTSDVNKKPVLKQIKNDFFESYKSYEYPINYSLIIKAETTFLPSILSNVTLEKAHNPPEC